MTSSSSFSHSAGMSTRGVVDLSSLGASAAATGSPSSGLVVEVTEANFQATVIDQSQQVPVVLDLWAEWCGPCKQLGPVLEKLVKADAGRWVLGKIDVDANQRLAAAFGAQSIPMVVAVVAGQMVPLFTGALPEQAVRQYLDELLRLAAQHGVNGTAAADQTAGNEPENTEPPLPPELEEAVAAIDRGDFDAAIAAYQRRLADQPGDEMAKFGVAQVELMKRVASTDAEAALRNADRNPDEVAAQTLAADVELAHGKIEQAFNRLLTFVQTHREADRDIARTHLVGLFDLVGHDDPLVIRARQRLTSALF